MARLNGFVMWVAEVMLDLIEPNEGESRLKRLLQILVGIPVIILLGIPLGLIGNACFAWHQFQKRRAA